MDLNEKEKYQLSSLLDHREKIKESISQIEQIIKEYFPEEYDVAYQHWIPQIITGLYNHKQWLPRGDQNMQKTIDRIHDKLTDKSGQTLKKYF